ncbi:unnamed protein product [Oikopleura dioica]|uniref:Uncharacterized protein n=1 Tax=Oikopleura dioica TaxID=34765 RepID=E4XQS1_OIKDI|nr:unnamed protein product [Oikopleura dioica]
MESYYLPPAPYQYPAGGPPFLTRFDVYFTIIFVTVVVCSYVCFYERFRSSFSCCRPSKQRFVEARPRYKPAASLTRSSRLPTDSRSDYSSSARNSRQARTSRNSDAQSDCFA